MPVIAKGLEGIIANSTALSDVRGEEGILIYGGYDINELAGKVSILGGGGTKSLPSGLQPGGFRLDFLA